MYFAGEVVQLDHLHYLGPKIQNSEEIEEDMPNGEKCFKGTMRLANNHFTEKKNVYRMTVRPAMFYGPECWAIKNVT